MHHLAAPKASARWGADTATTTLTSLSATGPVRWSSAILPSSGQRRLASAHIAAILRSAWPWYASYTKPVTPWRPSELSRTVPAKTTTAPHAGSTTQEAAASTLSEPVPRQTQSWQSRGGQTTSAC